MARKNHSASVSAGNKRKSTEELSFCSSRIMEYHHSLHENHLQDSLSKHPFSSLPRLQLPSHSHRRRVHPQCDSPSTVDTASSRVPPLAGCDRLSLDSPVPRAAPPQHKRIHPRKDPWTDCKSRHRRHRACPRLLPTTPHTPQMQQN